MGGSDVADDAAVDEIGGSQGGSELRVVPEHECAGRLLLETIAGFHAVSAPARLIAPHSLAR
jgi:hypothetical protein